MIDSRWWVVGGAIAVVWVAIAQLRTRLVRPRPLVAVVVLRWVLLGYGVVLVVLVQRSLGRPGLATLALLAALAAAAVGLGWVRGAATRVWVDAQGRTSRRGGVVVVALWALALALHLVVVWLLDRRSPGLGPTTMLAYFVLTLAAQNITVRRRAARLAGRPRQG